MALEIVLANRAFIVHAEEHFGTDGSEFRPNALAQGFRQRSLSTADFVWDHWLLPGNDGNNFRLQSREFLLTETDGLGQLGTFLVLLRVAQPMSNNSCFGAS